MDRGAWWAIVRGAAELDMPEQLSMHALHRPKDVKSRFLVRVSISNS